MHPFPLRETVARALAEDLGRGDVTSRLVVDAGQQATARIVVREAVVLAGLDAARCTFAQVDPSLVFASDQRDGARLSAGAVVARISGAARAILTAERVALNFLQHLSGIAGIAARATATVRGTGVTLLDTRKTVPGLRLLEKAAVRAGGVASHRAGLDDGILIKENHVACCGSTAEAVRRARAGAPALLKVEVEIETLDELEAVIEAGADIVLLDNFTAAEVVEAVRRAGERVQLEASGGIDMHSLASFAATGVHRISLGFLTHSAPAADLALELDQ